MVVIALGLMATVAGASLWGAVRVLNQIAADASRGR